MTALPPPADTTPAATMAEVTIAIGALLRHLPAQSAQIELLADSVLVEIRAHNALGAARWGQAIGAPVNLQRDEYDCPRYRGSVAGVLVDVWAPALHPAGEVSA